MKEGWEGGRKETEKRGRKRGNQKEKGKELTKPGEKEAVSIKKTIIIIYTKTLTAPAGNRTQGLRIYVSML